MNTDFRPSFISSINKIKDTKLKKNIEQAIKSVEDARTIRDIPKLRKLEDDKKKPVYYRIRVGRYRIGVIIENNIVTFTIVKHRKDVYKFFP